MVFEANSTARCCVLPGDLQGRYSDDMKVSNMLFLISIYSSRGWQILIPHGDMKISDMLLPISIYSSRGWRI